MKYRLLKQEDYKVSDWDGGTTKEMAIFPENANYSERDFLWRLSSAAVEKDEAQFSELPDYDRVLMVLEGEVVLSYEEQRVARLKALEQDRFDGGWKTTSFGRMTDYNLMVRKGNEGYLDLVFPEKEKKVYKFSEESSEPRAVYALYCREGYAVVSAGSESFMIREGEQLVLQGDKGEVISCGIMGEGVLIRAQIFYHEPDDEKSEVIPQAKATFDDFKLCMYLANVQFRWAKHFIRSLRKTWFDEELSEAIHKVESLYITALTFIAGLTASIVIAAANGASGAVCAVIAAVWITLDCLLISPAIYMIFMPKPIRKHIKDVDKLTRYEQKLRESEKAYDSRTEKIIKRYGGRGGNFWG